MIILIMAGGEKICPSCLARELQRSGNFGLTGLSKGLRFRILGGSWDLVSKGVIIRIAALRGLITPIIIYLLSPMIL